MSSYGHLRHDASLLTPGHIKSLCTTLDPLLPEPSIDIPRARHLGCLLLLCDFEIPNLIRVLRGHYTGDFLSFRDIDASLKVLSTIKPAPDEPPHDYTLLHSLFHEQVPFHASFRCRREDVLGRNLYNNHRASDPHLADILKKTAVDVQKSYAIALPRWILYFLPGLFLAALGYAIRELKGKIKGRQVNDPSAHVTGPSDTGALNDHIHKSDPIAMPKVHYQSALQRLWTRVYNLRVAHPDEDIIVYKDDLVSAFRRVRYHPSVAAAYAYVLGLFLLIPIGMVFGARDAPSLFCLLSEIRSFASRFCRSLPIPRPTSTFIDSVEFEHEPPPPASLAPASSDPLNKGIFGFRLGHQPTFVDDTLIAEFRAWVREAATNSVISARLFVGDGSIVEEPVSMEKFERLFSHLNETLGFLINTRALIAAYPSYKRDSLQSLLDIEWSTKLAYPIRSLARILGKLRNVSQILPFGDHLSIHLQLCLSKYIIRGTRHCTSLPQFKKALKSLWNSRRTVHLNTPAINDLLHLKSLLANAPDSTWCRPISLLIPRTPHFMGQSDACNIAMGGLCFDLPFQWRLSNSVFKALPDWIPKTPTCPKYHINIHEFIGVIINTFFMMCAFSFHNSLPSSHLPQSDGWIFLMEADNTSALSWMRHASRSRDPHIVSLCHFYSHLVFSFNNLFPSRFDGQHLAGKLNVQADALSRPQDFPSYQSIFNTFPAMQSLPAYRVPPLLISAINASLLNTSTKATLNAATRKLLSIRLSSLQLGVKNWESRTLL